MKLPTTAVDPTNPGYWQRPLWIVYGRECFPQLLCCKLNMTETLDIWGYSIYKRSPGFRTLGLNYHKWAATHAMCFVFAEQQHALDVLKEITTPKASACV